MATIVMTGGSSGFGAIAVRQIAASADPVIVGARCPSDVADSLDLARLDSVRGFAESVRQRLGDRSIHVLVLNAGLVRPDDTGRTPDGFETTFGVNHLAHYLLLRLLMPALADDAHVLLTTSGTHDPATGAALATPRHADADLLAHPDQDPGRHTTPKKAGEHAYTASKLCSVLTVRVLNADPEMRARGVAAVAFDPGQVFGTGLARDLSLPLRIAWKVLGTPIGAPLRRFTPTMNTPDAAGSALAGLVLGDITAPDGRTYAALRSGRLTWPDPSNLARDSELAQTLWADSARLVGLSR
ncbi:SDR family NAD(P)-dependent oxidoreductase [Nocardia sp. NPDC059180]|uniref:SDR family NAD(P)-dependent oxidoreductase n=1 Tax=Nocardia sp. NPDC059180 TaxID=3346761 RepID=UPI00367FE13E